MGILFLKKNANNCKDDVCRTIFILVTTSQGTTIVSNVSSCTFTTLRDFMF